MPMPVPNDADAPNGGVRVRGSFPGSERRNRAALVISFLLHVLVIYLAIRFTASVALPVKSEIGDAIQMVLGGGGGGGGQGGAKFDKANPPPPPPDVPPPVVPPPPPAVVPTPTKTPDPVPTSAAPVTTAPAAAGAGTGTGSGGGNGSGVGTGNGSGEGPGSGSGKGGGNGGGNAGFPPEPKQLVVPALNYPKELKGKTVDVTFTVSVEGIVLGVVIDPPITNSKYAKQFDEVMRGYRFTPGKNNDGKNVPGVVTLQVTF